MENGLGKFLGSILAIGFTFIGGMAHASQEEIYKFMDSKGVLILSTTPPSKRAAKSNKDKQSPQRTPSVNSTGNRPNSTSTINADTQDNILKYVRTYAKQHRVDSRLVEAVIKVESNFNPLAISPVGAQGLMQLIPATAHRFGVADPFDIEENIRGGVTYIAWLLNRFNNDVRLAVAGYNAGEGAVERHRGVPPYRETRGYVKNVLGHYRHLCANPRATDRVAAGPSTSSAPWRESSLSVQRKGRATLITNYR